MATLLDTENTPNGEINNLQIARITIQCRCGGADYAKGDKLYICKHHKCSSYYYCTDCGPIMHSLKTINDHKFSINSTNIISLNKIMNERENTNKSQYGQKQLISLIGVEKYNKIAPYFEKSVSLMCSNIPMCIMLTHELSDFYESVAKAVKAANDAVSAAKIAKNVNTATTINHQLNIFKSVSTTGNYIGSADEWRRTSLKLSKDLCNANHVKQVSAAAATKALNDTMSMKDSIKAGATGMTISTALELTVHSYRWCTGDISGKECCRLTGKTITRNAVSMVGTAIGGKLGAMAGCKIGVTVASVSDGFGKYIGGSVGIVSGMVCGYLLGKTAEWIYTKYLPPNEQEAKKQLVQEALVYFHFQEKDIKNEKIFNAKLLRKRFRQFSLDIHPDRNGGDRSEWNKMSMHYGVLKALLQQNDENKDIVTEAVKSVVIK